MKISKLALISGVIFVALFQLNSAYGKHTMTGGAKTVNKHLQVQLTTSIVKQEYSSNDRLSLVLRLTFTNVGDQNIILDKNSSLIERHMISRNLKAAAAKKYVEDVSPMISILYTDKTPEISLFMILKPGESYSLETKFDLFIDDGTTDSEDSLRAGDYFLQIRVRTWYYTRQLEAKFREELSQTGFLWVESIKSAPMPFKVEKKRHVI